MTDDEDLETAHFQNLIDDLRTWMQAHCTPSEGVSIMGALVSEAIWNTCKTNRDAEICAADFCARVTCHVHRLNEIEPDQTSTRTQ